MVLKQVPRIFLALFVFENDVKMYGTQTIYQPSYRRIQFENDVKMYGTQTAKCVDDKDYKFENDVKMYGTQTACRMHFSMSSV